MVRLLALTLCAVAVLAADDPDYLVLKDGEKVIGQLERATASNITFKSNALGEVSITWDKVQELHSSKRFAVIPKNEVLRGRKDISAVPVGTIALQDNKIEVQQKAVAVPDIGNVVSETDLQQATAPLGLLGGWSGGATGGVSLTEATQKNETLTGAINLVRMAPAVSWLDTREKTLIDFNSAYSKLTQPGTPDVKTSLIHFGLEQDWYTAPRLFLFGTGTLDHSFSQGLKLQQNYGFGVGYVLIKQAAQELDVRASVNYIDQRFETGPGTDLIGSEFGETYTRKFFHGILLNEQANVIPSWNETHDYTMLGTAGLTFPVYRRIGFTIGALDSYINNPPPLFKKNSFQLTVGATYSIK